MRHRCESLLSVRNVFYKKYPNLTLIGSLVRIFVYIVRTKYYLLLLRL